MKLGLLCRDNYGEQHEHARTVADWLEHLVGRAAGYNALAAVGVIT
jgi:hypothetical protein